jgi:hypothetical protein
LKDCDAAVQWALFMPETVAGSSRDFGWKVWSTENAGDAADWL